jgi:hypothetical protein
MPFFASQDSPCLILVAKIFHTHFHFPISCRLRAAYFQWTVCTALFYGNEQGLYFLLKLGLMLDGSFAPDSRIPVRIGFDLGTIQKSSDPM